MTTQKKQPVQQGKKPGEDARNAGAKQKQSADVRGGAKSEKEKQKPREETKREQPQKRL